MQTALVHAGFNPSHIGKHCLHAGQRGVAGTLSKTIDTSVNAFAAGLYGRQSVGHRQVIVVVGVEIEMDSGEAGHHSADKLAHLSGT